MSSKMNGCRIEQNNWRYRSDIAVHSDVLGISSLKLRNVALQSWIATDVWVSSKCVEGRVVVVCWAFDLIQARRTGVGGSMRARISPRRSSERSSL